VETRLRKTARPGRARTFSFVTASVLLILLTDLPAFGQSRTWPAPPDGSAETSAATAATSTDSAFSVLGDEGRRFWRDALSIGAAPFHWSRKDWIRAAAITIIAGVLVHEDNQISTGFLENRSTATNSFSRAVTPFGTYAGIGVSVAALGSGLIFRNPEWRDTGRDAIEAEILAAGVVTPVIKEVVGRYRPAPQNDADETKAFSGNQSFPSGHTTEAFAVASVIAARSKGWVVPSIAYALASGVALARINDRAHYPSDVFVGAVIGTAIGHAVVDRHRPEADAAQHPTWNVTPIASGRGAGIGIRVDW
jgi:PAP2 superfamily